MRKRISGSVLLMLTLAFSLIATPAQTPQQPPAPQPQPQAETPQPQTTKKRTSKKKRGEMTTTKATGDQTTTPAEAMPDPGQSEPAQTPAPAQTKASMSPTEQPDLSGTYAGTFTCDALGLSGDTTLTITGNQFTTADGKTGRIVASKTGGYTAVALQTGDVPTGAMAATGATKPGATAPMIVSLRARKSGNSLTLTPAAGSTTECRFAPTRSNVARRRSRQRTPAATGTEVSNPAAMPSPTTPAQPTPEQPQPMPSQTPEPSPTPMPSPTPGGTPMPSPTPSGSPTPEPAPTATPSPTPSPSPSPSPARPRG